jgi:hypothetical protein
MRDPLHSGNDHQVKYGTFVVFLVSCGASSTRPRIASQALRPGRNLQLFHRLLDPFYLGLRLVDVQLNSLPQSGRAGFLQCFLHAAECLLLHAICVLQFFTE